MKGSHSVTTTTWQNQTANEPPPHANLLSLNTSCTSGTATPVPGFGCLSRRDNAKALDALQAKMLLHLRSHAALTRFWRSKGADRECALARARKNCAVSSDHLPPTSAARTTRRALPPSPEQSSSPGWWGQLSTQLRPTVRAETASTPAPGQRAPANRQCRGRSGSDNRGAVPQSCP